MQGTESGGFKGVGELYERSCGSGLPGEAASCFTDGKTDHPLLLLLFFINNLHLCINGGANTFEKRTAPSLYSSGDHIMKSFRLQAD